MTLELNSTTIIPKRKKRKKKNLSAQMSAQATTKKQTLQEMKKLCVVLHSEALHEDYSPKL